MKRWQNIQLHQFYIISDHLTVGFRLVSPIKCREIIAVAEPEERYGLVHKVVKQPEENGQEIIL
jgi:hypothetical protein